jgi:hypothetical protein
VFIVCKRNVSVDSVATASSTYNSPLWSSYDRIWFHGICKQEILILILDLHLNLTVHSTASRVRCGLCTWPHCSLVVLSPPSWGDVTLVTRRPSTSCRRSGNQNMFYVHSQCVKPKIMYRKMRHILCRPMRIHWRSAP